MDESLECSQGENQQQGKQMQKSAAAAALSCPRCDSTNTKFCYYNNYSKLQPRHYCRACRRHWTEGGTLRNVPVGGSRKNKRLRTNQATSADAAADDGGSVDGGGGYLTPEHEDGVSSGLFLRQPVLLEPPPQYEDGHGGDGELSTVESWAMRDPPFLPEYYGGGASEEAAADILGSYHDGGGGGGGGNLFSSFSSSSCSSSFYDHAGDEGLFAMESSTTMQLPASNLSHWDDIIDLVNLELKPPATDRVDHSLTY